MLLGRRPRSRLDLLHPDTAQRVVHKQEGQGQSQNRGRHVRQFEEGDPVYMRNFRRGDKWIAANIHRKTGPVSYQVRLEEGQITRRHVDHLRQRCRSQHNQPAGNSEVLVDGPSPRDHLPTEDQVNPGPAREETPERLPSQGAPQPTSEPETTLRRSSLTPESLPSQGAPQPASSSTEPETTLRRSSRQTRPPKRLY